MPKIVDHDDRRREIIGKVWRLIASDGVEGVTTRRIAEATGYSNGALRYYFPGKESVIIAAFDHVFGATNDRAAESRGLKGLAALRSLAVEILPLDDERLDEARVVINFWQRALRSPEDAQIYTDRMAQWRARFTLHLGEAADDGHLCIGRSEFATLVDELLAMLMGAQVLGLFSPQEATPERLLAQLDAFIARIRADGPGERHES